MLSTTYFGLLRVGEVMASEHIIKAKDVHIGRNKNKLMMILQSSKTHAKNMKPRIIKIDSLGGNHITPVVITEGAISDCPFKILKEYLQVRNKYRSIDEQFFVFSDRTPVQPTQFNRLLKYLIKFTSLDSKPYSVHGLCMGRAADLLDMGVPVQTIMKLGRWKSSAIFTYLRA